MWILIYGLTVTFMMTMSSINNDRHLGYCKKVTVITMDNIKVILKSTLSWLTKDNSNTTKIKVII